VQAFSNHFDTGKTLQRSFNKEFSFIGKTSHKAPEGTCMEFMNEKIDVDVVKAGFSAALVPSWQTTAINHQTDPVVSTL